MERSRASAAGSGQTGSWIAFASQAIASLHLISAIALYSAVKSAEGEKKQQADLRAGIKAKNATPSPMRCAPRFFAHGKTGLVTGRRFTRRNARSDA